MKTKSNKRNKPQGILFVDFNGVISYDPFWASMQDPKHPLHSFYDPIEGLLFRGKNKIDGLIDDWMMGRYTSEEVHQILANKLNVPYEGLLDVFRKDCEKLDISKPILKSIAELRKNWYRILRTDNMDSFHRFTLPANPVLAKTFDEIHSSYSLRHLKKSDNGTYFTKTIAKSGIRNNNSVLIDDSYSNCKLFETLGGKAYCTQNENEVVTVLKKLKTHF